MTDVSTRVTLITAPRLLAGTGGVPIEQAALLMEGDRIVSLVARPMCTWSTAPP